MIKYFKSGKVAESLDLHLELYPMFRKIFMAPNPVPIKAALASTGIIKEYVRKPLTVLSDDEKAELMKVVQKYTCLI